MPDNEWRLLSVPLLTGYVSGWQGRGRHGGSCTSMRQLQIGTMLFEGMVLTVCCAAERWWKMTGATGVRGIIDFEMPRSSSTRWAGSRSRTRSVLPKPPYWTQCQFQ